MEGRVPSDFSRLAKRQIIPLKLPMIPEDSIPSHSISKNEDCDPHFKRVSSIAQNAQGILDPRPELSRVLVLPAGLSPLKADKEAPTNWLVTRDCSFQLFSDGSGYFCSYSSSLVEK